MNADNFFQSKTFKMILAGLAGIIIILLIFSLGMFIGFKKANFSFRWGENYHQNFAGPRGGFFGDFEGRDFIGPHGTFAQIIKIDGSTLVVEGSDNVERIVLVEEDTIIRRGDATIKSTELKVNDYIVVIGQPNDTGQIEAKFIRLMPAPPKGSALDIFPPQHSTTSPRQPI